MTSYAAEAPEPVRFRFGPTGEEYMIASEVCRYLGKAAGSIQKIYPSLWRQQAAQWQRAQLVDQNIVYRDQPIVTLVRAEEIDRIGEGDDEDFKAPPLPTAKATTHGILLQASEREVPPPREPHNKKVIQLQSLDTYRAAYKRVAIRRPCNPYGRDFRLIQEGESGSINDRSAPVLVPINIDVEEDNIRVRDSFCWNVYEPSMSVEEFVKLMCEELEVSHDKVGPAILSSMKEQISEFVEYNSANIRSIYTSGSERRILLKLQIHVGNTRLSDQFEWDLNNDDTAPELFAESLCADLGLGGEYAVGIAHSIREQLLTYKKVLVDTPHEREELPPVSFPPLRTQKSEYYAPYLEVVSEQDLEAFQKQREREARRMRRSRRRVGEPRRSGRTGN